VSAIMDGGDIGALNGLSDLRRELSVTTTAVGGVGEDSMAVLMSAAVKGEPLTIVRPGASVREDGVRTSAVTVWPLLRASWMTSFPVRPLAPIMRKCIFARCVLMKLSDGVLAACVCGYAKRWLGGVEMLLRLEA